MKGDIELDNGLPEHRCEDGEDDLDWRCAIWNVRQPSC